jgi:hypothetical protein
VEFLEAEFGKCDLVEQIWLYGSSFEATLVAVVVPVKEKLMAWAGSQGELQGKSFKDICSSSQANAHVLAAVTATGADGDGVCRSCVRLCELNGRRAGIRGSHRWLLNSRWQQDVGTLAVAAPGNQQRVFPVDPVHCMLPPLASVL